MFADAYISSLGYLWFYVGALTEHMCIIFSSCFTHLKTFENTLLASFELLKFIVGSRAPADGNKTNGNGSFIPESQIMPPLLFFYS